MSYSIDYYLLVGCSVYVKEKGTYSNILEGFQVDGSGMETPGVIVGCRGPLCPLAIITNCTAGESLLVSTVPAEMGGEIGWVWVV